MHCLRAKRLLDEYRDGELSGSRLSACEAHLRSCARCANAAGEREGIYGALRRWERYRASDELTARVVTAWQTAWPRARRLTHRRTIATRVAVGASALAVAGVMALVGVWATRAASTVATRATDETRQLHGLPGDVPGLETWDLAGRQ